MVGDMLISRCSEVEDGPEIRESNTEDPVEIDDHSQEYQTAAELFELMTSDHSYSTCEESPLLNRDLVLLYKNIDIGTQLMTNANELKKKKPNQYIEDVVYKDDFESDSDLSEIYSDEDLHNVFMMNKERIDFMNNQPSLENTMCRKFGDLEIQSSNLSTEYQNHFVFKDLFIKEQLRTLNLISSSNDFERTLLPSSLLDYICCKRLEDNYNFYMDNIIRYVKHTIEQLKRISNGDYLTERAKEKWRQVERSDAKSDNSKVLTTSTSIPLHVERKISGRASTWDDIIHSEVDIRSLSKILEKKIVVEIPKLICGSHKLFTRNSIDNLIISCKSAKEAMPEKREESRIDVVLQLKRSESGNIMSNISSIMILRTAPLTVHDSNPLPLPYKTTEYANEDIKAKDKIIELDEHNNNNNKCNDQQNFGDVNSSRRNTSPDNSIADDTNDYPKSDTEYDLPTWKHSTGESSELSIAAKHIINEQAVPIGFLSPDDLRLTIQRLNMQNSVPEESGEEPIFIMPNKKKSPNRTKIKSPYENKAYIMEEKKRKKLLEIRERREKKKMAMNESSKVAKHKYGRGGVMPQASSSVTKLSISNKSFYNSIYGQTLPYIDGKQKKNKDIRKKQQRDVIPEMSSERYGEESSILTPEKNNNKYINRSYYLDDTVTEMMYIDMKQNDNKNGVQEVFSASTSAASNNFADNFNIISQFITPSTTNIDAENIFADPNAVIRFDELINKSTLNIDEKENAANTSNYSQSEQNINTVPANTPKDMFVIDDYNNDIKKTATSLECRKSIDKIYDLMHDISKIDIKKTDHRKNNVTTTMTTNTDKINVICGRVSSTVQGSDSGTSLRHHILSSNPSCFSFEKTKNTDLLKRSNKNTEILATVVPKVVISSKNQTMKTEEDKFKRDRKKLIINTQTTSTDNPLKAISQLLHEFDNVQKIRQKPAIETKPIKKPEGSFVSLDKNSSRQNSYKRRSRLDQHLRDYERNDRNTNNYTPKERKRISLEQPKIPHQRIHLDDKNVVKIPKKKMTDIIDEAKEARGEAVRGPSKLNSRLNTLAQPKRSYVQAHSEEYQSKYGRNLMADRLQRLAAAPPPISERNISSASSRGRQKQSGIETSSSLPPKQSSMPVPLIARAKRSASSSPHGRTAPELSYKLNDISNAPDVLKKMIAVESYVKSHYRRASPVVSPTQLLEEHSSRTPLVPHDIELGSVSSSPAAEESSALGNKLHHIIDSMVNSKSPITFDLSDLTETDESESKNNTENLSLIENLSRIDKKSPSISSDYPVDVFQDRNIITAVGSVPEEEKQEEKIIDDIFKEPDTRHKNVQPFNSTTELEKLENALHRQMSVGAFHKRLRIKNLTLTPKSSMQQVLLLQSGDAGSVLAESALSQNIKLTTSKSENMSDLKALSALANPRLDWCFAKFPIQVATIGYAFPTFQRTRCGAGCKIKCMNDEFCNTEAGNKKIIANKKSDKTIQCFKGGQLEPQLEQYAQANVNDHKVESIFNELHTLSVEINKANNPFKNEICENTKFDENEQNSALDTLIIKENLEETHHTTSLDILVGLLNEIKNITTCQTHMTNTVSTEYLETNLQSKELETMLNNAAVLETSVKETSHDLVSITSLDKLRQLDSNHSIFSYYISNDGETEARDQKIALISEIAMVKETPSNKPICVDKAVTVDVPSIEYVNKSTDMSSQIFPITVNHSTNVTKSLVGVLSQPSSESVLSLKNYQDLYSSSPFEVHKKNIQLATTVTNVDTSVKSLVFQIEKESDDKDAKICNDSQFFDNTIIKKTLRTSNHIKTINQCVNNSDFDAIMKIKRDILVTVYSILVFTVFAALSFPDILYRD